MSGHTETQTAWEETNEEAERRRKLAKSEHQGWIGTVVGVSLGLVTLFVLMMAH